MKQDPELLVSFNIMHCVMVFSVVMIANTALAADTKSDKINCSIFDAMYVPANNTEGHEFSYLMTVKRGDPNNLNSEPEAYFIIDTLDINSKKKLSTLTLSYSCTIMGTPLCSASYRNDQYTKSNEKAKFSIQSFIPAFLDKGYALVNIGKKKLAPEAIVMPGMFHAFAYTDWSAQKSDIHFYDDRKIGPVGWDSWKFSSCKNNGEKQ